MKRISVSSKSRVLNGLLKPAQKDNIIIRARDGHEFVLAEIEDFDREIALIRQNSRLMRCVFR